ncbi:zinc finger BED domain-containing protein 4-like [Daktulosphaira vitifoliae]|uniref:zinc finger BED domain-containing protein 4-like n=1 Tax=Daktulosphaira vitifoliae TaxID=58002 RepID=UPI0021AA991D|nr:zinc finger BED domain-containing protein 4-like [Daktulosphaira vitifoliae]
MDKKTSAVWKHFSVISDEKAKCSYCTNTFSYKGGSTANLLKHLKRKHIVQLEARKRKRVDFDQNVDEPDDISTKQQQVISSDQPSTSSNIYIYIYNISKNCPTHTSVYSFINRPLSLSKQKLIDKQFGIMAAKEFELLSLVENIEFQRLINLLNPSYKLPSRKTLSKSILPQLYSKTKEKVKTNLINSHCIAFTTNGWTSLNNDSFVALTIHYIDKNECTLKSFLLRCCYFEKSHMANNLSIFLNNCFKEWEMTEKVKITVGDNAANITAAINMNKNWCHIPCLAHSINTIAQSGLDAIQIVHKIFKRIAEHFNRSSQTFSKLKNMQKQMGYTDLKLIQDKTTR